MFWTITYRLTHRRIVRICWIGVSLMVCGGTSYGESGIVGDATAWYPDLDDRSAPGVTVDRQRVAGPFVYDPVAGRSTANASSLRIDPGSVVRIPIGGWDDATWRGDWTVEAFVKVDASPDAALVALAVGDAALGIRRLRRWGQSYWGGRCGTVWANTGHYSTVSRLPDTNESGNNDSGKPTGADFRWRHLSMAHDGDLNVLTITLDRWQSITIDVKQPVAPEDLQLGSIDNSIPFWIDSVRVTPRRLDAGEMLRTYGEDRRDLRLSVDEWFAPRGAGDGGAGHLCVRRHFGAVGDGVHDDTAAFKTAMRQVGRQTFVTVPDGTYRIRDTIEWQHFRLLVGQSRDGVILKLDDNAAGFDDPQTPRAVLRCYYNQNESISNFIQNLTVDTGSGNAGAIGIRYNAHNQGELSNVTIRSGDGAGVIGLDLSETEFGPALIRDVEIDGFDIGIQTPGNVSHATMVDVTVRNQNKIGFRNSLPVSLLRFRSDNVGPAIVNRGWMSALTILDATLTRKTGDNVQTDDSVQTDAVDDASRGDANVAAIELTDAATIDARRLKVIGYDHALIHRQKDQIKATIPTPPAKADLFASDDPFAVVDVPASVNVFAGEVVTDDASTLHLDATTQTPPSLNLPIEDPPPTFIEPLERWRLVPPPRNPPPGDPSSIGASSKGDATELLRRAFNSDASTIVLVNNARYEISDTIDIGPSVRRIVGMKANVHGDPDVFGKTKPMFRVVGGDASTPPLHIEHLSPSLWPRGGYGFEIDSPRDCVIRYSHGWIRNTAAASGRLFVDEQMGWVHLFHPQRAFIRQLDTEGHGGNDDDHPTYLINGGGDVVVLGMKTESVGRHVLTTGGGRTEILGGFFRDHKPSQNVPYFDTPDGHLSAGYLQYAWRPGATRSLISSSGVGTSRQTIRVKPTNHVVGRLWIHSSQPSNQTSDP